MRNSGAVIALLSTGLLVLAAVTPAAAATGVAESEGVTWTSPGPVLGSPVLNPRISTFTVIDGVTVQDSKPRGSSVGDGGVYTLVIPDPDNLTTPLHSLTIGDVECVRVGSDWAEFAGVVTDATGGVYVVGEVFLVSVKDGGPGFVDDEIGMKSHGTDPDGHGRTAIQVGCIAALDNSPFFSRPGANALISAGDITVD